MASSMDSTEPSRPREVCRFFLSNACRYGDKCLYSHDQSYNLGNNICRYYLRGKCTYGNRCRYDHIQPRTQSLFPFTESTVNHSQSSAIQNKPRMLSRTDNKEPKSHTNIRQDLSRSNVPTEQNVYSPSFTLQSLCPYAEKEGRCEAMDTGRYCPYVHGDVCDLCELPVLHPSDEKQQEQHRLKCLKKHEADCEAAFATQRSQDKKCGVCLETVWNREGDKRFGLLENCDHIFCLDCIRQWRSSSNYENQVVKACPECRVKSDFVTPAKYWPENDQAKQDAIRAYKGTLQKIHCKFFKRGDGLCPFGSKCFYLHVNRQGQHVQLGPPRHRRHFNLRAELESFSDLLMVTMFSPADMQRFFDELDFLFDDDDDDDDDVESSDSYFPDEDDFMFANI